ncbi:unnamed protein product [Brassicogethes aeneus]|uniref:Uncharacterized protein n=1 Tax=Brassicogethes aeneus TaxID=1431903 RepID=A0A9P0FK04_BRAAE|nr:unnamed protein product [Brassicogethes aeneus]
MFQLVVLSAILASSLAAYNPYSIVNNVNNGRHIRILKQNQDIHPDGSYQWSYETENGIAAQELGKLRGKGQEASIEVQGSYSYTSPEGIPVAISYVADDTGYHPAGDLPTPPPIPIAIQRALAWNAAHPEEEQEEQRRPYNQRTYAQLRHNQYNPYNSYQRYNPVQPIAAPHYQTYQQPQHYQTYASKQHIPILRQDADINEDGSYSYSYETGNGIQAQEQATNVNQGLEKQAQGSYSYTSPEGELVQVSYVADGNGFRPTGSHIPTPPPIPAAIQRSLDWIASHPQQPEIRQYKTYNQAYNPYQQYA